MNKEKEPNIEMNVEVEEDIIAQTPEDRNVDGD